MTGARGAAARDASAPAGDVGAADAGPHAAPAGSMHDTVLARLLARAAAEPARVALCALAAGGAPHDEALTWGGWAERARAAAAALVADGVGPGDVVAVLAGNRLLWPVADVGALMAGAACAGVFTTHTAEQVRQLLADCGARVLVVDTRAQLDKVAAVWDALPALRTVVADDRAPAAAVADVRPPRADARLVPWSEWLASGRAALARAEVRGEVARRTAAAAPDDVAGLVYTSGSTGEPKGARLTHRYLLASAESIRDTLGLTADDTALAFLPLAHAAERVFGLYTRVVCGMEAALVEDAARVWAAAAAYGPTLFGGLPRFYEKALDALRAAEASAPVAERDAWARTFALGRERSRLRRAGRAVPPELDAAWEAARGPARRVLAALCGARVRLATSGGAPLPADVAESLDAAGLTVLGAYGQTEQLCIAMHRPDDYDFASVGRPMPGCELRAGDGGEVLVRRGALTFAGYHGRPEATRDAFTADGRWLRTGDLGEVDARGRLRVTGRAKEILVLSTGKKVAPLPIEARLAEHPWVAQAVCVGDGRRFVVALLCLRSEAVLAGVAPDGGAADSLDERLATDAALRGAVCAECDALVARVNADLSPPEQVRRYALVGRELTVEGGELTPTLKVRRAAVADHFAPRLEALYS